MPQSVVDHSANAEETVAHAAKVVGRGAGRRAVFDAIYTGKRRVKSAKAIAHATGLTEVRVLQEAKVLADNHIVSPAKQDGYTAYQKIDFYHRRKKRILALGADRKRLDALPTKRNPRRHLNGSERLKLELRVPRLKNRATYVTVDDIDSLAKVRSIGSCANVQLAEAKFKNGVAAVLGERGTFKDWGGESRDLFSTRLRLGGKRRIAAFAFKGPGKTGKLTPAKMGRNGDQIQRLVRCAAEVFIIQYWSQVEDSVLEQLKELVTAKAYFENKPLWYGIIDGNDSARLIAAYPKQFGVSRP